MVAKSEEELLTYFDFRIAKIILNFVNSQQEVLRPDEGRDEDGGQTNIV
jgi:hypothetical protein